MQLCPEERLEPIGGGHHVIVSRRYGFTTDTILLAKYSMPRHGERCAELGTGCGMVPLLWCNRGCPGEVYALEVQPEACRQAQRSVQLNAFTHLHVLEYDLRNIAVQKASDLPLPLQLNMVACNPPYQPVGDGVPSPQGSRAAAHHEIGCTLTEVAAAAARLLRWGGSFFCCLRPQRMAEAFQTFSAAGLEPKRMRMVQHRLQKAPFLFLLEARRGGRPGLTVEPVLLLEEANVLTQLDGLNARYGEGLP